MKKYLFMENYSQLIYFPWNGTHLVAPAKAGLSSEDVQWLEQRHTSKSSNSQAVTYNWASQKLLFIRDYKFLKNGSNKLWETKPNQTPKTYQNGESIKAKEEMKYELWYRRLIDGSSSGVLFVESGFQLSDLGFYPSSKTDLGCLPCLRLFSDPHSLIFDILLVVLDLLDYMVIQRVESLLKHNVGKIRENTSYCDQESSRPVYGCRG